MRPKTKHLSPDICQCNKDAIAGYNQCVHEWLAHLPKVEELTKLLYKNFPVHKLRPGYGDGSDECEHEQLCNRVAQAIHSRIMGEG